MNAPPTPANREHELTWQRLSDGSFLRTLRADPPPGVRLRSDEELEATLSGTLREHERGTDLHVFGYGSLMWNPALDAADVRVARVPGWHRRFCLRSLFGRGTPETPGVMLALDRGGACRGLLFRIEAAKVDAEMRLLWRREMIAGSYEARWVYARVAGEPVRALTFVASRTHDRYIADRAPEHVAKLILTGRGSLGSARAYFDSTQQALARWGIDDPNIERLRRAVLAAESSAR